jgi:hypothetical protein
MNCRWSCFFATILLLFVMGGALQSAAHFGPAGPDPFWTPGLDLSRTVGRSTFPGIARVADGEAMWVVWVDYSTDDPGEILGRGRPDSSSDWEATVNLSNNVWADEGAALHADQQGRLHLAWTRRTPGAGTQLLYRQWSSGEWEPTTVLNDNSVYIPSPYGLFFCQDVTGTLWLFINLGSGVRYTRLGPEGWEALSPWVYVYGMEGMGAIIGGDEGLFHVAALGQNEGNMGGPYDPFLDDAYYATTDGTDWSPLVNLAMTGTVAFDLGLAWDRDGALHLLWSDIHPLGSVDSVKSAVYERVLSSGVWSERVELTQPNVDQAVQDLVIASDPAGQLHLVWSEGVFSGSSAVDLSIRYLHWEGLWGTEETVYTSTLPSLNVDMVLDLLGEPSVVWEEGPSSAEEVFFSARQLIFPYQVFLPTVAR